MQQQLQRSSSGCWSSLARRLKKFSNKAVFGTGLLLAGSLLTHQAKAQTTILSEDFESGLNGWTVVNGTQPNQWFVGAATAAAGTQSAYISNDAGVSNAYTITVTSITHLYKDIVIPAAQKNIQLTFKWKAQGEGTTADDDNLKVSLVDPSTTITAGTLLPAANRIGQTFYNFSAGTGYATATIQLPTTFSGSTKRLVFTWENDDNTGTQPPISIDDISLTSVNAVPISGIFTIDNTQPTAGSNFASFTDAINTINNEGINGPVTFNVIAGQNFTEKPPVITATGTLANPIIFQKSGTGNNPKIIAAAGTSTTLDGIIVLAGSDYMTFDGIDLEDPATNTTSTTRMEFGYAFLRASNIDGAQFNTVKNSTITLQKAYTSSKGIYISNHTPASTTSVSATGATASGTNSDNKIFNNTVTNVYIGIYVQGISTAAVYDMNNEIGVGGANTVTNFGGTSTTTYGIYSIYQNNFKIANNIITGGTGSTSTFYGIFMSTATNSNIDIYNNNVDVTSSATSSDFYGIRNEGGASGTNNLVKIYNNTIKLTFPSATSGTMYILTSSASASNLYIYYNTINNITRTGTGSIYGLYNSGSVVNNANIFNNTISNITASGSSSTYLLYSSPASTTTTAIYENTINGVSTTNGTLYGIYLAAGGTNNVYRNNIYNLSTTNTSPSLYGIYASSGTNNYLYNNFVSDLRTPAATSSDAIRAIYVGGGTLAGVYNNTVYLNATSSSTTTFGTTGFYASTSPIVDLRNNIIVNTSTPGATGGLTVAYRRSSTTLGSYANTSNNNIFYAGTPAANRLIYNDGTNSDQSLGLFQNRVSPRDLRSVTELPPFINVTTAPFNLHLQPGAATAAESGGSPITSPIAVTTDFDGDTRNTTTPDIGADEGSFLAVDKIAPVIAHTRLVNTSSTTNRTLTATITDDAGIPTTGNLVPRVYYRKGTGNFFSQPGTLTSGTATNGTWSFTINNADLGGVALGDIVDYFIVAQDINGNLSSLPGGAVATDVNTVTSLTFVYRYLITAPIASAITVPGTYPSLTNVGGLFEAINNGVLNSNVTVQITADLTAETGTVGLNQWSEEGNGNYTLTIRPDAAVNRTISGSSAAGFGLIRFAGADRVTIDGSFNGSGKFLTITNTNTVANTFAILASSGAENNTYRNINVSTGSNTATTVGIFSAGAGNNNLVIENNSVAKSYYGIYAQNDAFVPATGLIIRNNSIGSSTAPDVVSYRGVLVQYAPAAVVSGNEIFNIRTGGTINPAGIELSNGAVNTVVSRNRITGVYNTNSSGYGAYGINIASGSGNMISNNMISDISTYNYSSSTTTYNAFGIRIDGGTDHKLYYNSVNLSGPLQVPSATFLTAPLVITSSSITGLEILNNIFVNSLTGTSTSGKSYAVYAVSGTTFATIDHNDYFVSGSNGVLGYLGSDKTTLADWRTATTQDVHSISVNPMFVSSTDLHINTSNVALNNQGTPIAAVTTDFDGDARSTTTPDMGADEYSPAALDLGATALVSPTTTNCFSNAEPISVTIKNLGASPIDFTTANATVTVTATVPTGATAPTLTPVVLTDNSLNGGNPLAVGATINVPAGTIDMTVPGAYVFNATTAVTTGGIDGNATNDAMAPVTITVAPLAAGTASASITSICQSGTTTLSLTGNSGGDVQWQEGTSATGPFTNITGATNASFTLPTAITQTTYYQAVVSCGNNNATSNVVTVTVNNPQIASVNGDTRCGAGTANLTATPSAGATINWYAAATGGVPLATGNTYSPNVTSTTTYYAEAASGVTIYNAGLTSTNSSYGSYGSPGLTGYGLGFTVTQPGTLVSTYVYPVSAGNVVVQLYTRAGVAVGSPVTVAVTTADVGNKTLIPLNIAIPAAGNYNLVNSTGSVYLNRYNPYSGPAFPLNSAGNVLSITGGITSASATPATNLYYSFFDISYSTGCTSARTAVTATVNPVPVVALGADINQCGTATVTLDAGNAGATYQWSLNGTAISGATSQTYVPTTSGTYSVTVTNANSCSASDDIDVTFGTIPAVPTVTASGSTAICSGSSVTLTAASTTTGATYQWFNNGTAITGATSATYTANAAGSYTVTALSGTCTSAASAATTVTVNAAPTPSLAFLNTTYCSNDAAVTLVAAPTGSTNAYTIDGTPATGSFNPATLTPGTHTVSLTQTDNSTSCSATTTTTVTINAAPATPIISQNGGTLTSSAATGNQWFLNGTAITGATGQTYVTAANGNYTVTVTNTVTGCSATSTVTNVTNTGVKDAMAGMSVQVYPNPANGSFNVKLEGYQKDATASLYNLAGQLIAADKVTADGKAKNINIKGLAAGTYLLKVTSEKGVQVTRLVVQ